MVMNMNKNEFITKLAEFFYYSKEKCIIINNILESNFFISKKNKDKIIEELIEQLEIDQDEAVRIYDLAVMIIKDEVKNKLKHPFKSKN